nr:hypothetical protein [Tanacetum cinerariifolium]
MEQAKDQLQAYLNKKEQMEQAIKEADVNKPKILKVTIEVVNKDEVLIKGSKDFLKHKDAHIQNTHVVIWRNKYDLDTMSFDDLYNNFKIVEQKVKGYASSSSSSCFQNIAFVSSPSNTNEVNTAYGVSTANTQNQDRSRRTVDVEETSSKGMVAIDGEGFDWSYMEDDEVPTNMALMAFLDSEEFEQPEFKGYGPKTNKSVIEDISNKVKESYDTSLVKKLVSNGSPQPELQENELLIVDALGT